MLHYVSEDAKDDVNEDTWMWRNRFVRGWLVARNDSGNLKSSSDTTNEQTQPQVPIAWRRGGFRQRAITRPAPLRRKHKGEDLEEVGYSREDYMRLQSECKSLKLRQEKMLERVHAKDAEMELHMSNMTKILQSSNAALKTTSEQLRSSQGTIEYLQNVILSKDLEIDRLRNAIPSEKQTEGQNHKERGEASSTPVHYSTSESSLGSLMLVDDDLDQK